MKLFFLLLFLALTLLRSEEKDIIQTQILEKILHNISLSEKIVIWSDNKNLIREFKKKGSFSTTEDCTQASILILQEKKNLQDELCKKAIFVLDYTLLKEVPKSFGSMFWKKGRPNIVIIEPRIKEQNIKVSKELEVYLEEKIW